MIKRITEIGIAVRDLASAGTRFHEVLGAQKGTLLKANEYNMLAQMWRIGNIEFELMQPVQSAGIIEKFLINRGEGLHHIAFNVDNILDTIKRLKRQNVKMINEEPVTAGSAKAVFLYPDLLGGVLIELIEGVSKHVDNCVLPTALQENKPVKGLGIEGILDVGIIVHDLDATCNYYSKIFMTHPSEVISLNQPSVRMRIVQAPNVNLNLLELNEGHNLGSNLLRQQKVGLNHVTMKVRDIQAAALFLEKKAIRFVDDPIQAVYKSKTLLIHPADLSGLPVVLKASI